MISMTSDVVITFMHTDTISRSPANTLLGCLPIRLHNNILQNQKLLTGESGSLSAKLQITYNGIDRKFAHPITQFHRTAPLVFLLN